MYNVKKPITSTDIMTTNLHRSILSRTHIRRSICGHSLPPYRAQIVVINIHLLHRLAILFLQLELLHSRRLFPHVYPINLLSLECRQEQRATYAEAHDWQTSNEGVSSQGSTKRCKAHFLSPSRRSSPTIFKFSSSSLASLPSTRSSVDIGLPMRSSHRENEEMKKQAADGVAERAGSLRPIG